VIDAACLHLRKVALGTRRQTRWFEPDIEQAFETVINLTREQLGVRGELEVANLGLVAETLK
jgi:hypothetical protein